MAHVLAKDLREAVLQAAISGKLVNEKFEYSEDYIEKIKQKHVFINESSESLELSQAEDNYPEKWLIIKLNDLFDFVDYRGKTPHKISKGVFLITASNIRNGYMDYTRKEYISEEEYLGRQSRGITEKGDLLFTTEAPMGMAAICDLEKCSCGQRIITFKPYCSELVNNELYKYFILSQVFQKMLQDNATGTTAQGIKGKKLMNFPIPLPPIEEQARIVARVDELMAKIDEYEKLENELVELKKNFPGDMKAAVLQAAMQGKLTEQLESDSNSFILAETIKNERKVLGKNKYVTDSVDELDIPETWTTIKSGECFSLEKGERVSGVNLPYLEAKYLRGKISATMMSSGEFVSKGTEVILVDGENSGEIFIEPEDGIIGSTFKILFIPKSIDKNYALYFLSMNRDLFRNNKKGAAIPHLSKEIFNDLTMPIPPIEEQKRIVEKLDKILPLCEELEKEIA